MDSKIVETLEVMCDKNNVQDKKILLLAELVESRFCESSKNQEGLKRRLDSVNEKIDKLTSLLRTYEQDTHGCPVYKNKDNYEKIAFFVENPKMSFFIVLGTLALIGGFFGANFVDLLKMIFGL